MDSDTNPQTNPTWKTRDPEPIDRIKLGFVVIAVVAALVLGASTQLPPWRILFVESLAGFALLIAMLRCSGLALRRIVWIIAALLILLPAIELVPLPATLWRIAPISDLWPPSPDGSFWRPLSLDADRTLQSLFAMQACVAIFLAVALLNSAERLVVIRAILLVAIASSLLGVLQMQAPTRGLYLLADAVPGTLTGFFGNRNHQGDFLVIAAGLATLFIRPGRPHLENGIAILLAAVLAATALATQSRSAMLLLGFTAFALAIVRFRARSSLIPIVLVLLCGLAALSSFNSVISTSFARFEGAGGKLDRATIWSQTKVAVDQTLPWGSGMGTFRPLYESVEPLALVSPTFVNHAHNDLLQLVAETGVPGLVVLLVVLAAIGLRARAVLADRGDVIGQTALVCLCVPLLHSLVDYPLRTLAIGSIAAVLMALLFAPVPQGARQPAPTTLSGSRRLLACLPVLILLAISLAMNLALTLYAAGRPALLVGIAPFSGDVRLSLASELVRRPERVDEAAVEAFAALNRNAFSSQALAIIGTARLLQNQQPEADAAFLSAAHLGWRDPFIQQYIFDRGIQTGSADTASRAADAILRRGGPDDPALMDRMAALLADTAFRAALIRRLADRPAWQDRFFQRLHPATPVAARAQLALFSDLAAPPVPRATISRLASQYLGTSSAAEMQTLVAAWREAQGGQQDPASGVVDPAFARLDGSLAPFGWQVDRGSKNATHISAKEPGTLKVQSFSARRQVVASQLLALPPGRYSLSYSIAARPTDRTLYHFQMRCLGGGSIPLRSSGSPPADGGVTAINATFVVPACAVQQLQLSFTPSGEQAAPVYISGISVSAQ